MSSEDTPSPIGRILGSEPLQPTLPDAVQRICTEIQAQTSNSQHSDVITSLEALNIILSNGPNSTFDFGYVLHDVCFPLLKFSGINSSINEACRLVTFRISSLCICGIDNEKRKAVLEEIIEALNECGDEKEGVSKHEITQLDAISILDLVLRKSKFIPSVVICDSLKEELFHVLCDLLLRRDKSIVFGTIVSSTLPLLLQSFANCVEVLHGKLKALFEILKSLSQTENSGDSYSILCSLADFYLPASTASPSAMDVRKERAFWEIIQVGLCNEIGLTRKRSMYLLKRALDVSSSAGEAFATEMCKGRYLFWWLDAASEELNTIWQDFVLVVETFEEQARVVKPVMSKLNQLVERSAKLCQEKPLMDTSWIGVLFRRGFTHQNLYVRKWTVECCMSEHISSSPRFTEDWQGFICGHLLPVLNDGSLFTRDSEALPGTFPKLATEVSSFLQTCMQSMSEVEKVSFSCEFISNFCEIAWSEVAMLYISWAVYHLQHKCLWGGDELRKLRALMLSGCLSCFDVHIRSSIQTLLCEAVLKLSDTSKLCFEDFACFLTCLQSSECLKRGTTLWTKCSDWLRVRSQEGALCGDEILGYLKKNMAAVLKSPADDGDSTVAGHSSTFAKVLILLCDAKVVLLTSDPNDKYRLDLCQFLQPVLETVNSMNHRAYMAAGKAESCLRVVTGIVEELGKSNGCVLSDKDELSITLSKTFSGCVREVAVFVARKVTSEINRMADLSILDLCVDLLTQLNLICPEHMSKACTDDVLPSLTLVINSEVTETQQASMARLAAVTILATVCKMTSHSQVLDLNMRKLIPKINVEIMLKKESSLSQSDWGRVVSLYLQAQWTCLEYALVNDLETMGDTGTLVQLALETFNLTYHECTPVVFRCLKHLVVKLEDEALVSTVFDVAWKKTLECSGSTFSFWTALECFIDLIFQPKFLISQSCGQEIYQQVHEYASSLLRYGVEKMGVANMLMKHLVQFWLVGDNIKHASGYLDVLIEACTFGAVKKRSVKKDVHRCIYGLGKDFTTNQIFGSTFSREYCGVRATIASLLAANGSTNSCHWESFRSTFLAELIRRHRQVLGESSPRNFPNSEIHRTKHRLVTAMMVLESTIDETAVLGLLTYIMDGLHAELQSAVRYYLEWLAIRVFYRFPRTLVVLWKHLKQGLNKKVASMCSMMVVVSHVCQLLESKDKQEEFLTSALPLVLPWCTAHHFNTRTFSQLALYRLWQVAKDNGISSPQVSLVEGCIEYLTTGRNAVCFHKVLKHFFFFTFHPLRDYSMQTIFHTLPRLVGLVDDEWISVDVFENVDPNWTLNDQHHHSLPLRNSHQDLDACRGGVWVINTESYTEADGDFQKKIMPWRSMLPDVDADHQLLEESPRKRAGQLVVVTSLIDKAPNLGGLCRTSEIFNVAEFVVGNLKVLDDRTFQALSVTAEKWLPVREVHQHYLRRYLLEMKDSGYTLVGVEQTANSKDLTQYEFPVKTLLLLGKEKSGIPVDLIQLLDVCVEIPQQGIVRSLNVHVSGALLIWEYTRQQLLRGACN